jgi:hypothetical protein
MNRLFAMLAVLPLTFAPVAADVAKNIARPIDRGRLPRRVHVFEDYETEIEKRWWLRGVPETDIVPTSLSTSVPNRRACRATETKDFDDKQGDPTKTWKAVVFNPVPGPPMGPTTRLSFRFWLKGADTLRVQIYSLTNGYHRHLTLTNLPQGAWQSAAVDMTQARRPDGSGGSLSEDERIDDIQFYIPASADLLIDDILLYEAAPAGEQEPFARRVIFSGWFDTGKQGAGQEWRGDFDIVNHQPPLTWKCARSVTNATTGDPWIRVNLRGHRPLSQTTRLRFRYRLTGSGPLKILLADSRAGDSWAAMVTDAVIGRWAEAQVDFSVNRRDALADELQFAVPKGAELLVDDVLLFEPGD